MSYFKNIIPVHSESLKNKLKVSKAAKIRNRYNPVPHLRQDTNGKATNPREHSLSLTDVVKACPNRGF